MKTIESSPYRVVDYNPKIHGDFSSQIDYSKCTVSQLIEHLQQCDPDSVIVCYDHYNGDWVWLKFKEEKMEDMNLGYRTIRPRHVSPIFTSRKIVILE